jgi:hypothetical protein
LSKATYVEAQELCKSRQMSLMSLETKTENGAVANFMGELGAKLAGILSTIYSLNADSLKD